MVSARSQENLSFEKVIATDSVGKSAIFSSINDWLATNYVSYKTILEMADKESGMIIVSPSMEYSYKGMMYSCFAGYIDYKIKIYIKDNRFKVIVTDFFHKINQGNSSTCELGIITTSEVFTLKGMNKDYQNTVWKDIQKICGSESNSIFIKLEELAKNIKPLNNDDTW
jgi:hypothetical protein